MYALYNVLLLLLAPIWMPWMKRRANRRDEPVNENERRGILDLPPKARPRLWLHTVSVGETVWSQSRGRAFGGRSRMPRRSFSFTGSSLRLA
ncbi:hypothetical protein EON81_16315, partial [bacterium]